MKKYHLFLVLFAFAFVLASCSKDDDSSENSEGTANIAVKLTDAPGPFESVTVEVEDVMIKRSAEGEEDEGWVSLGVTPQRIDLLELTGGVTKLLIDTEIEAGYLHQMRLVLGDNNTLDIGTGNELALTIPSGSQSGLKVQINQELEADATYTFVLDFDVQKSIVVTGSGAYNLKPVIRASVEENSGSITGIVTPSTEPVLVTAESSMTSASAFTNDEGVFELHALSRLAGNARSHSWWMP